MPLKAFEVTCLSDLSSLDSYLSSLEYSLGRMADTNLANSEATSGGGGGLKKNGFLFVSDSP